MKNNLEALNNYLFEQIERVNDDTLSQEELKVAISKAECVSKLAKDIIDVGTLTLKAKMYVDEYDPEHNKLPALLANSDEE